MDWNLLFAFSLLGGIRGFFVGINEHGKSQGLQPGEKRGRECPGILNPASKCPAWGNSLVLSVPREHLTLPK